GYNYDTHYADGSIKTHFMLVEPLTYMRVTFMKSNSANHYFGTVTDIAKMMVADNITLYQGFFATVMPLAIYTRDNPIDGSQSTAGLISIQRWVDNMQLTNYSAELATRNGVAAGHIWLPWLPPKEEICDLNNPEHFPTSIHETDRKCCETVANDLDKYDISLDDLYFMYPACDMRTEVVATPAEPTCIFDLEINIPNSCDVRSEGTIKDIEDWECIFNSRQSSENDIKTHFFSWENQYCSYYCREEVKYIYPGRSLEVLAGNHFTLGDLGHFPNLRPIRFIGTSECRPTSDNGGIDWPTFEKDWIAADANVKTTWDAYQISLKKDDAANRATRERRQECGCVYSTSHNDCCTRETRVYHSRTCYRRCNCSTNAEGVRTCDSCPYDCSYYTYPCVTVNNTYHYKYFPATVYYDDGTGSRNVTPASYCSRPDYGTSTNRTRYYDALNHRTDLENAITECNDWKRDYTEFQPDVYFKYAEEYYGGETYKLVGDVTTDEQTDYYINNVSLASVDRYKRTKTTYRNICNTTGVTCRKGASVSGSRYVYPTNDWLAQITTKEYDYGLPNGVYQYVAKPSGESFDYNPGGNYYDLGYSNLPVHYSRVQGWYDYELDYTSFGHNHKFDKYIFGNSKIGVGYGSNSELYQFIQDNSLMQYISQCASPAANCSTLNSRFYTLLRNGGQLNNFLDSSCAKNSFCRVEGSRIACGINNTFSYRGYLNAGTRLYVTSTRYWTFSVRVEVWNDGRRWWIKHPGTNVWDYLSRTTSYDRYYRSGDNYEKYFCTSSGGCTYQDSFYAPTGSNLDGKVSPSNFDGPNVYAKLQSCLTGSDSNTAPTDAFTGNTRFACEYYVLNEIVCPPGERCEYVGLSPIFRPIDLSNPFPGLSGYGRKPGKNWDRSSIIDTYITNNRGVETERVYTDLDPLYRITLTPAVIKEIRRYNDVKTTYEDGYADFGMQCILDGEKCLSAFLRTSEFSRIIDGCGIMGKNYGRCLDEEGW
ncbi:MAG: hypothetical protein PHP12_04175, partial [Bacilli bacterium]|nr:hypothetical protein [Bacilli bacterium]